MHKLSIHENSVNNEIGKFTCLTYLTMANLTWKGVYPALLTPFKQDDSIDFESASIGGIYSTIFSGEGFVTRITNNTANRQTVYLESRSKSAYLGYLKKNLMIK